MAPATTGARTVPAVVMAGDRGAAKAVKGRSKVYLELGGRPLVAHVVAALQRVPEISEVWVVGDSVRLRDALAPLAPDLVKPLHVIEQFRNLYENAWETYRRLLPGAGPAGRDPQGEADLDVAALYLSGDLPFATPQEIAAFVRSALARRSDYALGVVGEECVESFYPAAPGAPGIHPAYFNLREGRVRQSNLHLVRPGRIGNRHYIEDMYEHRYQKEIGHMIALGWRILSSEQGGLRVAFYYLLMHLAAVADRRGWRRLADWLRARIPAARIENAVGRLLRTSFAIVRTDCGGCAIDIDRDDEYEAAQARFDEWCAKQRERASALYGPAALPQGPAA
jgi:GTP:adenosylcobinamide-phosphate guanylyltransferase